MKRTNDSQEIIKGKFRFLSASVDKRQGSPENRRPSVSSDPPWYRSMNEINAGTIPTLMKLSERDGRSWRATPFFLLILAICFHVSAPVIADDYQKVRFEELSNFLCDPDNPDLDPKDRTCEIPEKVKALDKKMISIQGFMIPLEGDDEGRIKTFVLVKDQMSCCFGGNPRLNAWIFVKMKDKKFADYVDFVPITVSGQFEVGMSKLKGQVSCLYRMEGEIVKAPKL